MTTPWTGLLGADPVPWLLASAEPEARWVTLTSILGRDAGDREADAAHREVLEGPLVRALVGRLPNWERPVRASAHASPAYAPNLLLLLAAVGVTGGEVPEVEALLDQMLAHQDAHGRFFALAPSRGDGAVWGTLACDRHVITEAMLLFGRGEDPRVKAAVARMAADLSPTGQGIAWLCLPDPVTGFRGPGRRDDFCPPVTIEALRAFSLVPEAERPGHLLDAARALLRAWRQRNREKPYQHGHGRQFKSIKWPPTWYHAHSVLDAVGRFPELWRGAGARSEDRQALAELAACQVAYNFGPDGRVVPGATYRGFEAFSFGQKEAPSPLATALALAVLRPLDDLAAAASRIDVTRLPSSKGGRGRALPPRKLAAKRVPQPV